MNNQTQKAADAGFAAAEQIKTVVSDVNERAKTAMEKNAKIIEELADLGRGNVEAIVASSKVAAKGVETLSQDAADYSRKSFEDASAAFKSFAEVKSATDFFKLQGDFARSAFDSAVAESARVSRERAEAGRRRRRAADQPLHRGGRACEDPRRVTRESPNQ